MDFIFPGMPSSHEKQVQHVLGGGREQLWVLLESGSDATLALTENSVQ